MEEKTTKKNLYKSKYVVEPEIKEKSRGYFPVGTVSNRCI
jgi:hypothetical protein